MSEHFPYEYVGGGYFRKIGVPKGESAETLHGQQVIDWIEAKIEEIKHADMADRIAKAAAELGYGEEQTNTELKEVRG